MRSQGLGCLSPLGILAALVTVVAVLVVVWRQGGVLFSPGPLNDQKGELKGGVRSHAEIPSCSRCHAPIWSPVSMSQRCLECHVEVQQEIQQAQGLHGGLGRFGLSFRCTECHTEHQGPQASLTRMDPAEFPHEAVGFSLRAHRAWPDGRAFVCTDCHQTSLTTFEQETCITCHRQLDPPFMEAHLADFAQNCLACHDGVDRFARFDHNRDTAFPLDGAHQEIACSTCHQGVTTLAGFRQAPAECAACHEEPTFHAGAFPPTCADCHATESWTPARFDLPHTFPMNHGARLGKPNTCQTCHPTTVQEYTCYTCHNPTRVAQEHREEGILNFQNCTQCHPTGREEEAERFERDDD